MMIAEIVELDFGTAELREDGILTFTAAADMETIHLSQLETLLDVLVQLSEGEPKPFYTDNSRMKSLGHRERKYVGTNLHRFAKASAVKETSVTVRTIGFAINHLFRPKCLCKCLRLKKKLLIG